MRKGLPVTAPTTTESAAERPDAEQADVKSADAERAADQADAGPPPSSPTPRKQRIPLKANMSGLSSPEPLWAPPPEPVRPRRLNRSTETTHQPERERRGLCRIASIRNRNAYYV